MVHLVAFLEATQDTNGVFYRRLTDKHLLEPAFQRGIFFDVLTVFIQRGGTDQPEFTAGEQWLNHIARVHRRVTGSTCTNNGVQLVNEGNDLAFGFLDLVKYCLDAFFKLTAIFRTGNHGTQIKANQGLAPQ